MTVSLEGITVLDLASVGPAARASRMLADYGAKVVKVGPTSAKGGKQIRPPFFTYGANRGMDRVCLDLKAEDGRDAFLAMAAKADVVIESFRPGVAARLGVGWEACRAANSGIVYCATSGYGQDGPHSQWAGHDINYLAVGGFLHCSGRRADGGPPLPGATVADSAAGGMHAVIAILGALVQRATTGEGAFLDVSLADGVLQLMSLHVDRFLATGEEPGPGGDILTGRYAFYDVYETRDHKWVAVGAIEPAFYANLCKALGCEERIAQQYAEGEQDAIRAEFRAAFLTRDRDDWVAELGPGNACVSPVYTIPEIAADPQFDARGVLVTAVHPKRGEFQQVGPVLAGGDRGDGRFPVPDTKSTQTAQWLADAGLDDEDVARLMEMGVAE